MDNNIIQGKWKQIKGDIQVKWGKITDDELDEIDGDREKLLGRLQENYGMVRDDAEGMLKEFERSISN